MSLELSAEEQAFLAGELGPGAQKAMEIVVALGEIYDARGLVPIASAQVAGVSFRNLGEAGLEFLNEWGDQGARVRVPATLNPAGIDLRSWEELGFSKQFARRQLAVIDAYERMGVEPTCTCTPYLVGNVPAEGEHVAWSESSAVSYANSVLGARTNREGGPSALAAAIVGRTAAYGLHLDENRQACLHVDVRCPMRTLADFGALGYLVGRAAGNRVPLLTFADLPDPLPDAALKTLGASMAASGAVALYHVESVTPEARSRSVLASRSEQIEVNDLRPAYQALNADAEEIDLVWFGCPHADLEEMAQVVRLLNGRKARSALWVTTSRVVRAQAEEQGLVDALASSGAKVAADMCAVVAPMQELGFRTLATPSAKGATYLPGHAGLLVRYGPPAQCVEAAVTGRWPD
jgi:predicted aconitase